MIADMKVLYVGDVREVDDRATELYVMTRMEAEESCKRQSKKSFYTNDHS